MSYIYVRGYYESLNAESYEVRIIHNVTGTDTTDEFHVGPDGAVLTYESEDDTIAMPGIVHSRCKVETIWPTSLNSELDTLITNLQDAQDGDWIFELTRDSNVIWIGTILIDEVTTSEGSEARTMTITATDGLSLLKNVPFSDAGTAYTGYYTVFNELMDEIMQKWVLWNYFDSQTISTDYILYAADDVYNTDDQLYGLLAHPAGTQYNGTSRNRLNAVAWSTTNNQDETEYISTYDLLQSICLTYQWRLYSYGLEWRFIPVHSSDQAIIGYKRQKGAYLYNTDNLNASYDFQVNSAGNIRQKGREWTQTFTPQINEVRMTRDTNDGSIFLAAYNVNNIVQESVSDIVILGADTLPDGSGYNVTGNVYISNTSSSVTLSDRCGRFVLRLQMKFVSGATATYYTNELVAHPTGRIYSQWFESDAFDYAPFNEENVGYQSTAGYYYYHPADNEAWYYDLNVPGSRYLPFSINIPPPATEQDELQFNASIGVYDSFGAESTALRANTASQFVACLVAFYNTDRLAAMPNFDYVSTSTYGRGAINQGTTYIGDLPAGMGGIEVQTSPSVWVASDNWVNQADSTERSINVMSVEETLAAHYKSRLLERGSIVLRGASALPSKPFARFYDNDTGNYYIALTWTLRSSLCEMDVTLRKLGRNAIDITTAVDDKGSIPRDPTGGNQGTGKARPDNVMYSYNNDATANFAEDWSSVIGAGETKEMYWTLTNDGQGKYIDHQGETPASGYVIQRTVYYEPAGLHQHNESGWSLPFTVLAGWSLERVIEQCRRHMSKTTDHGAYTFMITYKETPSFVGILDTYSGATAAYSTRRLTNSYSGSLMRIRRTSDGVQMDVGYDSNGHLDTASIVSFAGGNACTVSVWKDQSGNGLDLTQTTTGSQPQIYTGSTFYYIGSGSRVGLFFAVDFLERSAGDLHSGSFYCAAAVRTGIVGNEQIFCQDDAWVGGTARVAQYLRTGSAANTARCVVFNTSGSNYADNTASSTVANNTDYIISAGGEHAKVEAFVNNVSDGSTSIGSDLRHGSERFTVGANSHSTSPSAFWNGRIAEVIIWDGAQSTSTRTGIVNDMDTYFAI